MKKMKAVFYVLLILCSANLVAQSQDSLPVHLLIQETEFLVKVNGKNIGMTTDFKVKSGANRIAIYKPFVGVFDTTIVFNKQTRPNVYVKIPELPAYRKEKDHRDWQIARLVLGSSSVVIAPLAVNWFIKARKEYDAAYIPVLEAAKQYESAPTKRDLDLAFKNLQTADARMAKARKKYIEASIFAPIGVLISAAGVYMAVTVKIPKLENRAKLYFETMTFNGTQLYPGLHLSAEL